MRESPALKIIELLKFKGANVSYHDPYIKNSKEIEYVELNKENYYAVIFIGNIIGSECVPSDIENIKNDPAVQAKFYQTLDTIYENLAEIKFSVSDFFRS